MLVKRSLILVCSGAAVLLSFLFLLQIPAQSADPTDQHLILFVAKEHPYLYRLYHGRAVRWGNARFVAPQRIVSDPKRKLFYVLDRPRLKTEHAKLWRIAANGQAQVLSRIPPSPIRGRQLSDLCVTPSGQVYLLDTAQGISRVETNGTLTKIGLPLPPRLSLDYALGVASDGDLLLTLSARKPARGGVFLGRVRNNFVTLKPVVHNYRWTPRLGDDTYWRRVSQVLMDQAGRILVVASGRAKSPHVGAGLFLARPGQAIEELHFKKRPAGGYVLRRPTSAAELSQGLYLVTDPSMYVPFFGGGGLLWATTGGDIRPAYHFGELFWPNSLAVLRGEGNLPVTAARTWTSAMLAGAWKGGPIISVESVQARQMGASSYGRGSPLYGFGRKWQNLPQTQAMAMLRAFVENARWTFSANGTLRFDTAATTALSRLLRQATGRYNLQQELVVLTAARRERSRFRFSSGSLHAHLQWPSVGHPVATIKLVIVTADAAFTALFQQALLRDTR